jgi:ribonuclease P/MRP protein subunit RPP1
MHRKLYDFNTRIPAKGLGFEDYFTVLDVKGYSKTSRVTGIEIKPKTTSELRSLIKKFGKADFTILTTDDYDVKRVAVDKALVDVIAHNERGSRRSNRNYRHSGVDHVIAKKCAENKVSVNICFNDFLKAKDRGVMLGRMRQNVRLCLKYGAPIIVSSGAERLDELVPADNLVAFAEFLGMNRKQAVQSLSIVAEKILERRAKK